MARALLRFPSERCEGRKPSSIEVLVVRSRSVAIDFYPWTMPAGVEVGCQRERRTYETRVSEAFSASSWQLNPETRRSRGERAL